MLKTLVPCLLGLVICAGCTKARYADDTVIDQHGTVSPRPATDPAILVTSDHLTDRQGPVYALVESKDTYSGGAIVLTGGRQWMAVTGEPWRYYVGTDAERGAVTAAQQTARLAEQDRRQLADQRNTLTDTIRKEEVAPIQAQLQEAQVREATRSDRLLTAISATPTGDPLAERAIAIALANADDDKESVPIVKPIDRDQLLGALNVLNQQLTAVKADQERAAAAAKAAEQSRQATEQALHDREAAAAQDRDRAAKTTNDLEQVRKDCQSAQEAAAKASKERDALAKDLADLQKRFTDLANELSKSSEKPTSSPESGSGKKAAAPEKTP